ncbi:MAG: hypothetical protein KGV57_04725 [Fusobacterium sp.]|nr:hypothetical protein [Fusobacterium sp.]
MIYIITALYIEAKPLIENFSLKKNNKFNKFQVFSNEKICLIISGVGRINCSVALTYLISNFEIKETDFILNIGFAGALDKNFNLKDTAIINKIINPYNEKTGYLEILYKNNFREASLLTFDKVIEKWETAFASLAVSRSLRSLGLRPNPPKEEASLSCEKEINSVLPMLDLDNSKKILVDMEGFAFYESAKIFFKRDKIIVLKIISDIIGEEKNQEREILDFKNCDFNKIYSEIFNFIQNLLNIFPENNNLFDEEEEKYINKIIGNFRFSETMKLEFLNMMKYYKLCEKNIVSFLKNYEDIEIKNKNEGKRYFEDIKKRIID